MHPSAVTLCVCSAQFPRLKPQSFETGEEIFRRGHPSNDLLFLLEGEVTVLSSVDNTTPIRIIRRTEEALICVLDASNDEVCFSAIVAL